MNNRMSAYLFYTKWAEHLGIQMVYDSDKQLKYY